MGDASTFVYDAAGARLIRRTGAEKVLYLDGMEVRAEGEVVTATRFYANVATRTTSDADRPLTVLIRNQQNSATAAIDANLGAAVRRRYLPYGGHRTSVNLGTGRGFLDKTEDVSGLVSVGARLYDPANGRFLSVDPVADVTAPQSLNGYSYAFDNPTTFSDPSGLFPCPPPDCVGDRTDAAPAAVAHDKKVRQVVTYMSLGIPAPDKYTKGETWTVNDRKVFKHFYINSPCVGLDHSGCFGNSPIVNRCVLSGEGGCGLVASQVEQAGEVYSTLVLLMLMSGTTGGMKKAQASASSVSSAAAGGSMVTLFRHVDPAELADIRATGRFNLGPHSTGKYFTNSADDAATWGRFLNRGKGAVVTTRVPQRFMDNISHLGDRYDGIGTAYYVRPELVNVLNDVMSGIVVL